MNERNSEIVKYTTKNINLCFLKKRKFEKYAERKKGGKASVDIPFFFNPSLFRVLTLRVPISEERLRRKQQNLIFVEPRIFSPESVGCICREQSRTLWTGHPSFDPSIGRPQQCPQRPTFCRKKGRSLYRYWRTPCHPQWHLPLHIVCRRLHLCNWKPRHSSTFRWRHSGRCWHRT